MAMSTIISQIKTLKAKIILFMLAFFSATAPLPCRGLACTNCFACFLILPLVIFSAYFRKLKEKLAGFAHGREE